MDPKKKAAAAPTPAPDLTPNAGQLATKPTTTSSSFDDNYLDVRNKRPFPLITTLSPPGSHGPKDTTPVAANIGAKSSVPIPSSIIKATISHVEDALPKFIYALSTRPASAHWSLKNTETTLWMEDNNYLVRVSLPNFLILYQIEDIIESITTNIKENTSPQDTSTKNFSSD